MNLECNNATLAADGAKRLQTERWRNKQTYDETERI